ncbi:MAG: SAM-dependent methyltransferase, partial [Alphaproteobacteria bacterium]
MVATPIGNMGDLSPRALAALKAADAVLCEDSRTTGAMLARLGIAARLIPLHDHNEANELPRILAMLQQGQKLALVSDAGTPLVSDPGFRLVRAAIAEALPISAIPGPNAAVMALILSGLPPEPFLFQGFLPPR